MISRLATIDRGQLDSLKESVSSLQFAQAWNLDSTGNWSEFKEDSDGDGSWDLDQDRTSNRVNEITDIAESSGPSWITPAYNRAGNMTTIPQPADPTKSYAATYDAWNRLVKIADGSNTIAEYKYDGAKRRTVKRSYTAGTLAETRHFYYTEPAQWQVIEERLDNSTDADRHFIWGLRYVDDFVLRDRDTTAAGGFDEHLYGMQDANWNLTSVANSLGVHQERFSYDPYGTAIVFTSSFAGRLASTYDWETRFAGCRLDSLGYYHIRMRSHVPHIGWVQRDPVIDDHGASLYQYCGGDPLSHFDPSGQFSSKNPIRDDFCSFMLSDCVGNSISCLCGVVDWLGIAPEPILSTLNCICEVWDVLLSLCQCGPYPLTIALPLGEIDCVLGFIPHPAAIVGSIIVDVIESIVDSLFYAATEAVPPDLASCAFFVKDCFDL